MQKTFLVLPAVVLAESFIIFCFIFLGVVVVVLSYLVYCFVSPLDDRNLNADCNDGGHPSERLV